MSPRSDHHSRFRDGRQRHSDAALRQRHLNMGDDHLDRGCRSDGGYFVDGVTADRFPSFTLGALIKLIASAYLLVVHWLTAGPLERIIDAIPGEIAALFTSGFIICFPPLVTSACTRRGRCACCFAIRPTPARSPMAYSPFSRSATTSAFWSSPSCCSLLSARVRSRPGFAVFLIASGLASIVAQTRHISGR